MADEASAVSGWAPIGDKIAGSRDSATGELEPELLASPSVEILRQLLSLATAAIVVATLYLGQDVLIPITLAVILAFILAPVVNLLQAWRLWRTPSVLITVLAALALIGVVGTLIGTQAASLGGNATQYASAIQGKVERLQTMATTRIEALSRMVVRERKPPRAPTPTNARGRLTEAAAATAPNAAPRPVIVEVAPPRSSPMEIARTILEPILGPLETTFIVIIVAIFVLVQKEDLRDRFIRVFGSGDLHRTTMAINDAAQRLSRYFLAQLALNTSFGIIVTTGLWLLGVPSPALWGVLAGLFRFVPYIGAVLAAVGPVALALAIDPSWSTAFAVIGFFFVTEAILGYVVEPLLYGHSTGLSPVSVIIAAIFWTWLWGPIGLIISTPVTLCLVVLGRHVKALEFFDVLLGDRPALTPAEGFYQRVLADNADEALAQAEAMLGDRDLASYYDEVVLEALKLAAIDEARGTIDRPRIRKMTRTMNAVIDDLSSHAEDDIRPGAAIGSPAIACVAGQGPFDNVVAAIMGQVLGQRGRDARILPQRAVSRNEIAQLDLTSVETIIICCLELGGSPAHLRYLIRRLRQKLPDARIIVGIWPEGERALTDVTIQSGLGADRYVQSLREAADAASSAGTERAERKSDNARELADHVERN